MQPWASRLTSLSLKFLHLQNRDNIYAYHLGFFTYFFVCGVLRTVLGTYEVIYNLAPFGVAPGGVRVEGTTQNGIADP